MMANKLNEQSRPQLINPEVFAPVEQAAKPNILKQEIKIVEGRQSTFVKAGHWVDQMLKPNPYALPGKMVQGSLFDELNQVTKDKIKSQGLSIELINKKGEGIKLTGGEYKLIQSLSILLHEKSQRQDTGKDDAYLGNLTLEPHQMYSSDGRKAAGLGFSLYEIAKEYAPGQKVSGKHFKIVSDLIDGLINNPDKWPLIRYERIVSNGRKADKYDKYTVETFSPLFTKLNIKKESFEHGKLTGTTKDVGLLLNPVFRDQIISKYIIAPRDIIKRLESAYGNPKLPEPVILLYEYLNREFANKRFTPSIGLIRTTQDEPGLYYIIDEKTMKERGKVLVEKRFKVAIEVVKKIGLLESVDIRIGKGGLLTAFFTLNKDWLKS